MINIIFVLGIVLSPKQISAFVTPQNQIPALPIVESGNTPLYRSLSVLQKHLFKDYVVSIKGSGFEATDAKLEDFWVSLSFFQVITFAAVTHALEGIKLEDTSDSALSLVERVTDIRGRMNFPTAIAQQFNIKVRWRPDARAQLYKKGFFFRTGWGHVGETGVSYHRHSYGLHLLFLTADPSEGHAHIDYRTFGTEALTGHFEGHFTSENPDITAVGPEIDEVTLQPINNLRRYEKWFGPLPGYSRGF